MIAVDVKNVQMKFNLMEEKVDTFMKAVLHILKHNIDKSDLLLDKKLSNQLPKQKIILYGFLRRTYSEIEFMEFISL